MPIPKQVIGGVLVVDPLYQGIVVLEICPIASRSCKRTLVFLPSAGFPLGVWMKSPIHAQLFDKLLNLWHLKGLTMH